MKEVSKEFREAMLMYVDEKLDGKLALFAKMTGASRSHIYRIKNGEQLSIRKDTYEKIETHIKPYIPLVTKDRDSSSLQSHFLITSIAENLQNCNYKQLKDWDKLIGNKHSLLKTKAGVVLKTLDQLDIPALAWDEERSECLGMNKKWKILFDIEKYDIDERKLEDVVYWIEFFTDELSKKDKTAKLASNNNDEFMYLTVV